MRNEYPALSELFGLNIERKIAESGIRNVFTPHQPISETDLLFGRTDEVRSIVQTLNTPGQHVLLYGERGVGKSSLANVVASVLTEVVGSNIHSKRCDQSDTFESIVRTPLAEVGADLTLVGASEEVTKRGEGSLRFVKGSAARTVLATYSVSHSLSPSTVAEAIQELDGLLVVDEVDAVGNPEDLRKLAELVKLLSDAGSKYKVMIVGIAKTGAELIGAHTSVQRCLRETKIERMTETELRGIIEVGAPKANLRFTEEVITSIVRLSAGYPHFTHLIALKCAEQAIAHDRTTISDEDLQRSLVSSVSDAEATLKRRYDNATRSANTEMYRNIAQAASLIESEEFSSSTLRQSIKQVTKAEMSQGSLNNFLKRLVGDDDDSMFTRTSKGVYRFTDPRMASFIRIVAEAGA